MEGELHLRRVRDILGQDVVLLPCKFGTKKPMPRAWQKLTVAKMSDRDYLRQFKGPRNIGVLLGEASGGLVTIDIDDDDAVKPFLERNPALRESFRTRGTRGCNIWVRMAGEYPGTTFFDWGEFRSTGAQTIICGKHPSGKKYEWLTTAQPATVSFNSLVAPDGTPLTTRTETLQRDRETEEAEDTQETDEISGVCVVGVRVLTVPDLISLCLPSRGGANHKNLHKLNRGIRTLELQEGQAYDAGKRMEIFNQWYAQALPTGFLRPDQTRTEYLLEFMASNNVKTPLGADGPLKAAVERAKASPEPREAAQFGDCAAVRLLVSICYQLQLACGDEPFFLSSRKAAEYLGMSHTTCSQWLAGLCSLKILNLVSKGSQKENKASRYRYASLF
jgi:hypothetical protein